MTMGVWAGLIAGHLTPSSPPQRRQVPVELLSQLTDGGRLIIPVGGEDYQELKLIRREGSELLNKYWMKSASCPC